MKIRITKELPEGLEGRPEVGGVYEAELKMTAPPSPREAYFIHVGPQSRTVCVFPSECEEVEL